MPVIRPQCRAAVLKWASIEARRMNRWLLPTAVVALLVVAWQHRGQELARVCTGIVSHVMPAQESVSSLGGAWEEKGAHSPGANPLQAFCRNLAQGS